MTQFLNRRAPAIAMIVALLLVAMMVTRTSQAAFTASTDNTGNSFTARSVELTDNDGGLAMFTLTDLQPGDSQTECIEVTYNGTGATQNVVFFSALTTTDVPGAAVGSGGLSDHLQVQVVQGDASSTCAALGAGASTIFGGAGETLADLDATAFDYASGLGGWVPGDGETRAYELTVTLDPATPADEQGAATNGVGFVWEIQG